MPSGTCLELRFPSRAIRPLSLSFHRVGPDLLPFVRQYLTFVTYPFYSLRHVRIRSAFYLGVRYIGGFENDRLTTLPRVAPRFRSFDYGIVYARGGGRG